MNEPNKPAAFWTAARVGLPAFTAVVSFIAAFTTEHRAGSLSVGGSSWRPLHSLCFFRLEHFSN